MTTNNSAGKEKIEGRFKKEFYMDRKKLAQFLRELAGSLEKGNELEVKTDNWVLPFKFRDNIEVEIDSEADELEIELEFDRLEEEGDLSIS
ncbi:MAG: amphi-Trp domain-containing protein [Elusimicrobiota bacterium]